MAKALAMVENNQMGRKIRIYYYLSEEYKKRNKRKNKRKRL